MIGRDNAKWRRRIFEKISFFLRLPLDRRFEMCYNNEGESLRRYRDIGKIGLIFKNKSGYGVARIGFLRNGLADGKAFFVPKIRQVISERR